MGARTQLVVASTVLCLAGDVELRRMVAIWCYRCRSVSGPKRREEAWLLEGSTTTVVTKSKARGRWVQRR